MKSSKAGIGIVAIGLTLVIAAVAFAHGGYGHHRGGYGGHMMDGQGYGYGHMMDEGYGFHHMRGYGGRRGLSDEQVGKVEAEQERFFDQTRALRQSIHEKELALQSEMAKQDPDAKRLAGLQKELSRLNSDFDQLALKHRLTMGELMPEGFAGRGMGRRGGGGPGYCW